MVKKASVYGTVPTGHRSRHDASSSASDTSVVPSSSSNRKHSHATLHKSRPRSTSNPAYHVSLNLVMKVQPLSNDEYDVETIDLCLNDVNVIPKKVQQRGRRPASASLSPIIANGYESEYDDPVFLDNTSVAGVGVAKAKNKNSETEESAKTSRQGRVEQRSQQQPKKDTVDVKPSVPRTAKDSRRPSHDPSSDKKTATPVNRYKNKRSLLKFSSLKNRRNSAMFDDDLPRRLCFDDEVHDEVVDAKPQSFDTPAPQGLSAAANKKVQTTGNRYKNKQSLFPALKNRRSKSDGSAIPGYQPLQRLTFNDSYSLNGVEEMRSHADKTFPLVCLVYGVYPLIMQLMDKAFQNSLGLGGFDLNNSLVPNGNNVEKSLVSTGNNDGKDSSLSSVASMSFSDVSSKDVACDLNLGQPSVATDAPTVYNHQKQIRLGFLANGVHMAVNLALNLRSDENVLYLEPVELLYEGNKMWRRSVRVVEKEIEAKRLADEKKKEAVTVSTAKSSSSKSTANAVSPSPSTSSNSSGASNYFTPAK